MLGRIICALALSLSMVVSSSAESPQQWQPLAANSPLLVQLGFQSKNNYRASYRMQRLLAVLSRPLQSSGEMLVTRDGAIIWQQSLPIAQTLVVAQQQVQQFDSDGLALTVPELAQQVILAWLPVMEQVVTGQWQALATQFTMQHTLNSTFEAWHFRLTPIDPKLASHLQSIDVQGAELLSSFRLQQANGDEITIHLSPLAERSLSSQERSWLND